MEYYILQNPVEWIRQARITYFNGYYNISYESIYSGNSKSLSGCKTLKGAKISFAHHIMTGAKWELEKNIKRHPDLP
jgi:hypothetical protein